MEHLKRLGRVYGAALGSTVLAFVVVWNLGSWSSRAPFVLFLGAIMVSAFHAGMRAGLLATGMSLFFLAHHHLDLLAGDPPVEGMPSRLAVLKYVGGDPDFYPSLLIFGIVGLLASFLSQESRNALKITGRLYDSLGRMRDGVIFTDAQGRVTYLNGVAEALTGWPTLQAKDQRIDAIFRPADEESKQLLANPVLQLIQDPAVKLPAGSRLILARDGTAKFVEAWPEPMTDTEGKLTGVLLILRDVDERMRKEEELRHHEEQYRTIAARLPAAVVVLDGNGRCTFSNQACQSLAGFSPEQSQGDGWVRFVPTEDQHTAADWVAAAKKGVSWSGEMRFRIPGGKDHWVRVRADLLKAESGRVVGHVGVLEDVGPRKQLEAALIQQKQTEDSFKKSQQERDRQAAARVNELTQANGQLQEQLDRSRTAEQGLRQELEQKTQHCNGLEEEVTRARQVEEELRGELAQHHSRRRLTEEGLRQELEQVSGLHRDAQQRLAGHQQEAESLRQRLAHHQGEVEELRQRLTHHQGDAEDLRQRLADLRGERDQLDETHRRRLADHQAEIDLLREELNKNQGNSEQVAQLQERETYLHGLVHQLGTGVVVWDVAGEVSLLNPRARELFGFNGDGLPKGKWEQRLELYRPDGQTPVDKEDNPFLQASRGQAVSHSEVVLVPKRGPTRTLSVTGGPLPEGRGNILVLHDLTPHKGGDQQLRELLDSERKQVEEHRNRWQETHSSYEKARKDAGFLQSLTDCLEDGVCVIDPEHKIQFLNPAGESLLGWPETEVVGRDAREVLGISDLAQHCPGELRGKNGEPVRVECGVTALRDGESSRGWVLSFCGKTEAPPPMEKVPEPQPVAEKLVRLDPPGGGKSNWLQGLAHQVKTELAPVQEATAILEQHSRGDSTLQPACSVLDRQVKRIHFLVDNWQAYSEMGHNNLRVRAEITDLNAVVERAVDTTLGFLEEKGCHLLLSLPLAPTWVAGDPHWLGQAVGNLLAVRANHLAAGSRVRLTMERQAGEVLLRTTDPGPVPGGDDDSRMALVRQLADLHGGRFEIAAKGNECEMTLRLPAPVPARV